MFSTSSPESFRGFTFAALGDGNFFQRLNPPEFFSHIAFRRDADFGDNGDARLNRDPIQSDVATNPAARPVLRSRVLRRVDAPWTKAVCA